MNKYSIQYFINERLIKTIDLTFPNEFDILANMPDSATDVVVLQPPARYHNLTVDNLTNLVCCQY